MSMAGLDSLKAKLEQLAMKAGGNTPVVVVGYSQSYALAVHENLNARHAEGKQAKYLEGPARAEQATVGKIIKEKALETGDLASAMLTAGLYLQRVSQEVVPIDTGALRASSFTCLEEDLEQVAEDARMRGEVIQGARQVEAIQFASKHKISKTAAAKRLSEARAKARSKKG
jgi:hypothetical protein